MPMILWVALGGAIGSAARYSVNVACARFCGTAFPWGTLTVNIAGSFLMGVLISAMALKFNTSQEMRAFLTTGILGGFTTFSAFSMDFAVLAERGETVAALAYMTLTVAASLAAIFAGLWLTRTVLA
jgi:fluoride exporter